MALMKQLLDCLQFWDAFPEFGVPEASSNRGYATCLSPIMVKLYQK